MCEGKKLDRRELMKYLAAAGLSGFAAAGSAAPGAMIPGKGWVAASDEACKGDGTPLQFIPKTAPDAKPLENELEKYPKCPYCGMDRKQWHHSRHLVQYDDNLVDGTCSIHCLAISLSLNLDRGPKAIYAADFDSADAIKPLVPVDEAHYLIGSKLRGTMSRKSKMAFASAAAAEAVQAQQGGELGSFDDALKEAYLGMHADTMMVRKKRSERRKHMMMKKQQEGKG
jgi:nitrous oxide reductase accessory protein NosL